MRPKKKFRTTIFKENDTEKLTTAPTKARIPVRIKSSDPMTGSVARNVPPQVPAIVESDLNDIILFVFLINFNFFVIITHHRLTHCCNYSSSDCKIRSYCYQSCR